MNNFTLSEQEKEILLKTAREVITAKLENRAPVLPDNKKASPGPP